MANIPVPAPARAAPSRVVGSLLRLVVALVLALTACAAPRHAPGETVPLPRQQVESQSPAEANLPTVCLSLRVLQDLVVAARNGVGALPAEALTLAGIGLIDGYYVDRELRDVVLLGRRSTTPLHLDDLTVALAHADGEAPWCSLDPQEAGVVATRRILADRVAIDDAAALAGFVRRLQTALGGQRVVVGGVPLTSAFAHCMIDADYDMKRIAQGLLRVPGIAAAIDMQLAESRRSLLAGTPAAGNAGMHRYWYHVADGAPAFLTADEIVKLAACPVVILTEAQRAAADGKLNDGGTRDPVALAWARAFSDAMGAEGDGPMARAIPAVARLVALYRLVAVTRVIAERGEAARAGLDLAALCAEPTRRTDKPMPATRPGLANVATDRVQRGNGVHVLASIACGGVTMEMETSPRQFDSRSVAARGLPLVRTAARAARPLQALSWVVHLPALYVGRN